MPKAISKDGARITHERSGAGEPVVLIAGEAFRCMRKTRARSAPSQETPRRPSGDSQQRGPSSGHMRTLKRSLVSVLVLVVVFAAGFGAAKILDGRASTASAQGQADQYRQVLTDLQRDYYKPLDIAKLGQQGIAALLASLHDPYTVYFSPLQAKQFSQELSGSYTGIGVAVDVKSGQLTVTKVFPGSPAARAGIKPGDVIVSVNGKSTAGQPASADVARITGPAGTTVSLQLHQTAKPRRVSLTLTRRAISLPLTTSRLLNDHGAKVGYVSLSSFAKGAGAAVAHGDRLPAAARRAVDHLRPAQQRRRARQRGAERGERLPARRQGGRHHAGRALRQGT